MILSAQHARSMVTGLVAAALQRPREAFRLLRQTFVYWPAALMDLRDRARLPAQREPGERTDAVDAAAGSEEDAVVAIRTAHGRLVRTEQMLWLARNPLPSLRTRAGKQRWPVATIGRYAIVGLHALEYLGEAVFRWTQPVFLLRLALVAGNGVLTLETRNLRRHIGVPDIIVVAGGRVLSSQHLALDDAGNLRVDVMAPSTGDVDVVVIVQNCPSRPSTTGPGANFGLPLFSIHFEYDDSNMRTSNRPRSLIMTSAHFSATRHYVR